VTPDADTFKSAAAGAAWDKTPGFAVVSTDQPGKASWPITGATFVLVHKTQPDAAKIKETLKFIDWSYKMVRQWQQNSITSQCHLLLLS